MTTALRERDPRLLDRLVQLSVDDGHDAFADVPWDDPAFALRDEDLRGWSFDPVRLTPWWDAASTQERQAYVRDRIASMFRIGWEFENILQRGLLEITYRMPNGHPTFRYIHHEVIEESHHTLMFNELVARLNPDTVGMPAGLRLLGTWLGPLTARRLRPLFYVFVLGGELPIDHMQRLVAREDGAVPPLVAHVCRIHVDEESRHVSFARQEIEVEAPALGGLARAVTSTLTPVILGIMTRMMVHPSPWVVRQHAIPRDQLRVAYREPSMVELRRASVRRARQLCERSGLMGPVARRLWGLAGL